METVGRIRREHFLKGKTIKEIARDLKVSRNTVRKVLRSGETSFEYEREVQPRPKLGRWTAELDELLSTNATKAPREQLTLIRIFEELRGRGYRKLAERGDVRLAFCWVHVRRNFYKLAVAGPAPIASEALQRIAALYAVEKDIRGRSAEERRLVRQQRSCPLIDAFEPWLRTKLGLISQKGKLAEAINYGLSAGRA